MQDRKVQDWKKKDQMSCSGSAFSARPLVHANLSIRLFVCPVPLAQKWCILGLWLPIYHRTLMGNPMLEVEPS